MKAVEHKADGLKKFCGEFPAGTRPVLTVTSRVATKNRVVDLPAPVSALKLRAAQTRYWLRPTKLLPPDGIVKERAVEITSRAKTGPR